MSLDVEFERQVLAIFGAVVDLEPAEQSAQLKEKCHQDIELLTRVQKLLDLDKVNKDRTSALTAASVVAQSPQLAPGTQVGNYRIGELIGTGGMGAVYQAERADGTFERTVAIKFLNAHAWNETLRHRFDAERRIMSRLEHPNITSLLDGGSHQEQPYLVMEYVQGHPFIYDKKLSINEVLQRFAEVCAAVSHAHNNLILHRDIKPDNVLVGTDGHPKLLDFGVSKLSESVTNTSESQSKDLTSFANLPMTPQYTAPEVLAGEPASVASDIYALGLLLYEVVSGKRPYELRNSNLIEAAQLTNEPISTKGLTPSKDINTILGTALHRDPTRRYASALALRQDVDNVLRRRPIAARAENWFYTATRFVQRHLFGTATSLLALAGLITMLSFALSASQESDRQRVLAEQHLETAQYSTNFLLQTLRGGNPILGSKPLHTIDEALAAAEERLEQELPSNVSTQIALYATLGQVFSGREDSKKTIRYLERAEALLSSNPDVERAPMLSTNISAAYLAIGRPKASIVAADRAIALRDTSPQPNHLEFGRALLGRASSRQVIGDVEGARADILEAIAILDLQDEDLEYEYASAHMALGYIAGNKGDFVTAENQIGQAVELLNKAGRLDSPDGIQAQFDHAQMLAQIGRQEEAIGLLGNLIRRMRDTLGPTHQRVLWSEATFGALHTSLGQPAKAVAIMEPSLSAVEAKVSKSDELYAYFVAKLGYAMCHAERYQDGLVLLEKSLVSRRLVYPDGHWTIPDAEFAIGYCHMQLGQDQEAIVVLNQAKENFTRIFGPEHQQIKAIQQWLAEIATRSDS